MKSRILLALLCFGIGTAKAQWYAITSPYPGNLWTIEFADQNLGFIGGNTAILKTTDGGNTWTSTTVGVFSINTFSFVSPTTGYYGANNNVVAKTTNAGSAWVQQNPNVSPFAILSLHFLTADVGYAVANAGEIRKTINGGATWSTQYSGTTYDLNKVHFFDQNTGVICGESGRIRRTTDGGSTWSIVSSPTTANLYDMFFVNSSVGFIAGASGTILKTTTGGISWTKLTTGATSWMYSVCFKNTMEGFVGGENGALIKTIDGGATWTLENSGLSFDGINDIIYINNRFIAVADAGKIITNSPLSSTPESSVFDRQILVYPNPFQSEFTIQIASEKAIQQTEFVLYDQMGRVVRKINDMQSGEITVDRNDLPKGIYFYKVMQEGLVLTTGKLLAE